MTRFQQNGQGQAASQWAQGQTQPADPQQIQQGVGGSMIDSIAQRTGLSAGAVKTGLAVAVPFLIHHLVENGHVTPDGRPTGNEPSTGGLMSMILSRLGLGPAGSRSCLIERQAVPLWVMRTLSAARMITGIGAVIRPVIGIGTSGLIEDISSDPAGNSDRILAPAFLDIHIHGAAGEDVFSATPAGFSRIGRFLATRGTSHYLPTTVTAEVDATLAALDRIAERIEKPTALNEAIPVGLHLEGPFLSQSKRGVHPRESLQAPSIELFVRFQQAARGHILLLTVAPELPGALDLIRHATSSGVRVSLGHTNANYAETVAAVRAGATSATHTFNAMRSFDHREPGVLAAILNAPEVYAELICDGVHVAPAAVDLWWKLKRDHAILVTDAMSATGMPDGNYRLAGLPVTVQAPRCTLADAPETLAGSVLTLDRAVAHLQHYTGCSLAEAVRAASSQPARMLGLEASIASLRPGQPASFNQFSPDGQLEATWLNGIRLSR